MPKIFAALNEKGGCGKTTSSVHIAAGLAIRGYRVLLIDADPQGHATLSFGLSVEPGLYNLLVRDADFKSVVRLVSPEVYESPNLPARGVLAVIPSNIETRNIAGSISNVLAVYDRLQEIADSVDVVIFDTSPTPSLLHGSIFIACDGILLPTTLEYFSFTGLMNSLSHLQNFDQSRQSILSKSIKPVGIIPMMYRANTVEHSENLASLRERYGSLVWEPVPMRITWAEAAMHRRPVYSYAPESDAAADAWRMTQSIQEVLQHV